MKIISGKCATCGAVFDMVKGAWGTFEEEVGISGMCPGCQLECFLGVNNDDRDDRMLAAWAFGKPCGLRYLNPSDEIKCIENAFDAWEAKLDMDDADIDIIRHIITISDIWELKFNAPVGGRLDELRKLQGKRPVASIRDWCIRYVQYHG